MIKHYLHILYEGFTIQMFSMFIFSLRGKKWNSNSIIYPNWIEIERFTYGFLGESWKIRRRRERTKIHPLNRESFIFLYAQSSHWSQSSYAEYFEKDYPFPLPEVSEKKELNVKTVFGRMIKSKLENSQIKGWDSWMLDVIFKKGGENEKKMQTHFLRVRLTVVHAHELIQTLYSPYDIRWNNTA